MLRQQLCSFWQQICKNMCGCWEQPTWHLRASSCSLKSCISFWELFPSDNNKELLCFFSFHPVSGLGEGGVKEDEGLHPEMWPGLGHDPGLTTLKPPFSENNKKKDVMRNTVHICSRDTVINLMGGIPVWHPCCLYQPGVTCSLTTWCIPAAPGSFSAQSSVTAHNTPLHSAIQITATNDI